MTTRRFVQTRPLTAFTPNAPVTSCTFDFFPGRQSSGAT